MKAPASLQAKLVVLVLAAIIPLLGMALFNAWRNADGAVNRATEQLTFAASLVAANQLRIEDAAQQMLTAIASAPGLLQGRPDDCQRYLKTLNDRFSVYANLGIIGSDGYLRCDALTERENRFLGDRDYFQQAVAKRAWVSGGYLLSRASGKPIVTFAMPMLGRQDVVAAVAFITLDLEALSRSLAGSALPPGGRVSVMDRQGLLLAVAPGKSEMIGKPARSALLVEAVAAMRTGVGEAPGAQGERRLFAFMPVGNPADAGFFVTVSADRSEVLAPVHTQLYRVLLVLLLVAASGGVIAGGLAGRIMRPAKDILKAIRSLESGQLQARASVGVLPDGGELSRIASGFNQMADALQRSRAALEAELLRSRSDQKKLQEAHRLARTAYWRMDLATGGFWWSDEVYEVLGAARSEPYGHYDGFVEAIHPSDRALFTAAREEALRSGDVLDTELRVLTSAGDVRWVHIVGRLHTDTPSALLNHRSGVIQDITHRKLTELAMARSKEMLRRTGTLAKVGGWEWVLESGELLWSEQTYRIHDRNSLQAVTLEDSIAHYQPAGQEIIRAAMASAIRDGRPWDRELPLTTALGRRCWVRTQGQALLEGGKVVRLVGALQDITEQHAAQEFLRLLETSISRLNDLVVITDAAPVSGTGPHIVFVNEAFERHNGYHRNELVGRSPRFLHGLRTQAAELERVSAALEQGLPVRSEQINYTQGGREYWVELDIVPIFDAQGLLTNWISVGRDISLRKASEQALIESEQRYAALFEAAPLPMWVYDREARKFLTVNKVAQHNYGYSSKEFLAMQVLDIHPEEDRRLAQNFGLPEWLKGGSSRHRRKDGSVFPVDMVSQPIQYAGREACFAVAIDVTAKVKAESDVQQHLFTLQRAADAAQAITWHQTLEGALQEIVDQARGVIGAHQAWVSLSQDGLQAQGLHARSVSEKYGVQLHQRHPFEDAPLHGLLGESNRSLRLTQTELLAHPVWQNHQSPDTPLRGWLAVPLTGRNGGRVGVLQLSDKYEGEFTQQDEYVAIELAHLASAAVENAGLLQEIGVLNANLEQKVADRTAALARQEALFRALAEQAPEVIWTANPEGEVTYINRTWTRLVGGRMDNWMGTQWVSVIHRDDLPELQANWDRGQASCEPFVGIRRVRALDGVWHTMSYRASPVLDTQGELSFWVGIDTDITEFKAIEAALRLSNQELEAFSYSVSHDLRAPLNTVDGFSRLLAKLIGEQNEGRVDDQVQHYLARIHAGVAQMGQLIEDLLSLAQVTRTTLRSEAVDLSLLAHGMLQGWQDEQPGRAVVLEIEAGLLAQGDGRLIKVVLENLLGNAWKFTLRQPNATIRVGQTLSSDGTRVFFVSDNGVGFDMAYVNKLFMPFHRLHSVEEFAGTGVGLATVSRVVGRHGGCIWAEAKPGQGATFFFTLPALPLEGVTP